ncbi:hypothetical protein COLO4_28097 [Corchorus olitorius]|uniref:Uncharacterized protein n=1 Tax=Corchorus olitorius TaxID=93759 RepID=A0A1R3HN60_9ROSI|nr:hypothetical protein COLO4_28097 [Corchorus olitorius]
MGLISSEVNRAGSTKNKRGSDMDMEIDGPVSSKQKLILEEVDSISSFGDGNVAAAGGGAEITGSKSKGAVVTGLEGVKRVG